MTSPSRGSLPLSDSGKVLREEIVFSTPWFALVSREIEGFDVHYVVNAPDYVNVLALSEQKEILLIRQFRPAVNRYTLELPGGHVDAGETPQHAAERELIEETGYASERIELLGSLTPDTARLSNRLWCYFAADARPIETTFELEVIKMPLEQFQSAVATGRFDTALHIAIYGLAAARGVVPLGNSP